MTLSAGEGKTGKGGFGICAWNDERGSRITMCLAPGLGLEIFSPGIFYKGSISVLKGANEFIKASVVDFKSAYGDRL